MEGHGMRRRRTFIDGFACTVGLALVVPGAAEAGYREEILQDNPVAYWRLGEQTVHGPVVDSSGNGLDGTYVGDFMVGLPGAIAGDPDTAAWFQRIPGFACGKCGQVQVPVGATLDLGTMETSSLTLEAWFKLLPNAAEALPPSAFPRILHYN